MPATTTAARLLQVTKRLAGGPAPSHRFSENRLQLAGAGEIAWHDPFLTAFNGGDRQLRHHRKDAGGDTAGDTQNPCEHLLIDLAFAP